MKSLLPPPIRSLASALRRCRALRAALIVPLAATLLAPGMSAQTSAVPGLISYQGRVSDASGNFVGAPNPVNRTVTFRIWNHPSDSGGSNLIYAEQQTVTIFQGEFSVLIGQGAAVTGQTSKGPPNVTVGSAGVFSGDTRYLGVTVDDGTSAADTEISPRQQMASAAFALRAKYAEVVGANGASSLTALDNGNIGIGTANPGARLEVSNGAVGLQVIPGQLNGNTDANAVTFNIPGSSKTLGIQDDVVIGGNAYVANVLGIGIGNPGTTLDVRSATPAITVGTLAGTRGALYFGNAAHGVMRAFAATDTNDVGLFTTAGNIYLSSTGNATTSQFVLNGAGNVGIGTGGPTARLFVQSPGGVEIGLQSSDAGSRAWTLQGGSGPGASFQINDRTAGAARFGISPTGLVTMANDAQVNGSATIGLNSYVLGASYIQGSLGIGVAAASKLDVAGAGDVEVGIASTDSGGRRWTLQSSGVAPLAGRFQVVDRTAGSSRLTIDTSGRVGVGTTAPEAELHVAGTGNGAIFVESKDSGGRTWSMQSTGTGSNLGKFRIADQTSGAGDRLAIDTAGNVGIGTITPVQKLHVSGNSYVSGYVGIGTISPSVPLEVRGKPDVTFLEQAYLNIGGAGDVANTSATRGISIKSEGSMLAATFYVESDERIKTVIGKSSGSADLAILRQIDITDYSYRDQVAYGRGRQKKVIAQQVEQVFPLAVSRSKNVVPDIFKMAEISDGWISLATDLKVGERVRLVGDSREETHEILEVASDRFRTAFNPTAKKIFVYGREVSDFRTVDYEAIAMLNVSATQEIKREKDAEVAALRAQNAVLAAQVDALSQRLADVTGSVAAFAAKDQARDARLASIEKVLASGQTVMARPAAAPRANASDQE